MPEYSILGKRLPRVDALNKATGRALYSGDINLPNMLHAKILRSPYAHAMIRRLDISRAKALKGVVSVIVAADLPERKVADETRVAFLAKDKVKLESVLNKYAAKVIQYKGDAAIIEAVGGQSQIKLLLEVLNDFGIKELVRTGRIAVSY